MTTLFISGIDTHIGKTIACAALANSLLQRGVDLCTQKWIETGCDSESQDLLTHQSFVGRNFNQHEQSLHSPYRFKFPASPHLAANLEQSEIDANYLIEQTQQLSRKCDHLLIEGAGGLCVPLDENKLMVDLVHDMHLPIVLVTSARLGSINHTVLCLELCRQRELEVRALIYNQYPGENGTITDDTRVWLKNYLTQHKMSTLWLELEANASSIALDEYELDQLLHAS